jgi:hypothetical protein
MPGFKLADVSAGSDALALQLAGVTRSAVHTKYVVGSGRGGCVTGSSDSAIAWRGASTSS